MPVSMKKIQKAVHAHLENWTFFKIDIVFILLPMETILLTYANKVYSR